MIQGKAIGTNCEKKNFSKKFQNMCLFKNFAALFKLFNNLDKIINLTVQNVFQAS